jgi:predicted outer membrane repeat protein
MKRTRSSLVIGVHMAILGLIALFLFVIPAHATDYTVGGPCGATIQACIDYASAGDRVLIPAGTYNESLTLNRAVSLVGEGSATTIIQAPADQRVLAASGGAIDNTVVISGLTFADGTVTGWSCPASCGGGILLMDNAQPLLSGIVVSNSQAYRGGGLYAHTGSSLTLADATFIGNVSYGDGGGVCAAGPVALTGGRFERNVSTDGSGGALQTESTLQVTGTTFISNSAYYDGGGACGYAEVTMTGGHFENNANQSDYYGGGLYAESLVMSGTTFISNTGYYGGGLFVNGVADVRSSTFIRNYSYDYGGGAWLDDTAAVTDSRFEDNESVSSGGGLYVNDTLVATGTTFISNTADYDGAGVYAGPGATLIDCHFESNQNTYGGGGGLYTYGTLVAAGTTFLNNAAQNDGGGAYAPTMVVTRSAFIGNAAGEDGGGLHCEWGSGGRLVNVVFARNTSTANGAALYLSSSGNVDVIHATVADSSANPGQAIYVNGGSVAITNTIIANHTVGIENASGTVVEDYNLFFANTNDTQGTVTGGGHSTYSVSGADPHFLDPAADDYHLGLGSAAVDQGVNAGITTDIDGDPRPSGLGYEIGADEAVCVTGVTIDGPLAGTVGTTHTFTATVTPADASPPVAYTWSPQPDSGQGTAVAGYTWSSGGPKTISVDVSGVCGTETAEHIINLCQPLLGVSIDGPTVGLVDSTYRFVASVSPVDASQPIAYTWSPEPDSGQGSANVQYTWATTGTKTISITASNCGGAWIVDGDRLIAIKTGMRIYLPLLVRTFTP